MEIEQLDHFTTNVSDLDASTCFYTDVVGLTKGARPDFPFGRAWLYCGERPLVHLIDDDARRKGKDGKVGHGTGALDHVAFRASGLAAMRLRLREKKVDFAEQTVPGQGLQQIFLDDPDGIRLEFNFLASEGGE